MFSKISAKKRLPKILGDLSRIKIDWKWAIMPFFICSKILGESDKQEILQQMFRKFEVSNRLPGIFRKLTLGAPDWSKDQTGQGRTEYEMEKRNLPWIKGLFLWTHLQNWPCNGLVASFILKGPAGLPVFEPGCLNKAFQKYCVNYICVFKYTNTPKQKRNKVQELNYWSHIRAESGATNLEKTITSNDSAILWRKSIKSYWFNFRMAFAHYLKLRKCNDGGQWSKCLDFFVLKGHVIIVNVSKRSISNLFILDPLVGSYN